MRHTTSAQTSTQQATLAARQHVGAALGSSCARHDKTHLHISGSVGEFFFPAPDSPPVPWSAAVVKGAVPLTTASTAACWAAKGAGGTKEGPAGR